MPRPHFVVCDSDATIQILLTNDIRPFQLLRSRYAIQPVITPEVEIELRSNRKFGRRIGPQFKKALVNRTLQILDRSLIEQHYEGGPAAALAATAALGSIAQRGKLYQVPADFGEAYTHAAAVVLDVPSLSHDRSALDALLAAGHQVPSTVLRCFDLLALFYQVGDLTAGDCDTFRAALQKESEWVPAPFKNRGFVDGLATFCPRILDGSVALVGVATCPTTAFSSRILL